MSANQRPLSTHCTSITTFDANGTLDTGALRDHYARIADAGVGLYVGGPAAEGWNLTPTEVRRSLELALGAADNRVPVYYMGVEPRHALGRPGTGLRSPHLPANAAVRETIATALQEFRGDLGG